MSTIDDDLLMALFDGLSLEDVKNRLEGPLESVRGLPNATYNSSKFFNLEQSRLFPRGWTFAGRMSDATKPGERYPITVAGQPLFIVRDESDTLRIFHNVCPHRGARIVTEKSQGQSIVCPYHSWTFHLDGDLRARPHFHGPGSNDLGMSNSQDKPCLMEVRSTTWGDWVFVNVDGKAPPFEEYIAPLEEQWQAFNLTDLNFTYHLEVDYQCNWKLAIENYCDFYHVFKVHPDLNRSLSNERRSAMVCDGVIMHNETWVKDSAANVSTKEDSLALPHLGGKLEDGRRRTIFGLIFPNCALNIHRSDVQFSYFEPLSPTHTRLHRYFYFCGDSAFNTRYESQRQQVYTDWEAVLREDEGVCQLIQEGRQSKAYDGGRLVPAWDEGTRNFHRLVVNAISGED